MNIVELETKNGRVFRVAVDNANQMRRLQKVLRDNKEKSHEVFTRIDENRFYGIHNIAEFEKIASTLV